MSASTERKNRKSARDTGTDRKVLAAQEEAKKQAASKRKWTIGTVIAAVLVITLLLLNSGLTYNNATALTVGSEKYSPAQVQYYMGTQYYGFVNQYGSYASIFGLDTSYGVSGLGSQACPMAGGDGTWKAYFIDAAAAQMTQIQVLNKYAQENGITLGEEEYALIDASMTDLAAAAETNNMTLKQFLKAYYGGNVSEKLVRNELAKGILADKAFNALANSKEYSESELEAHYTEFNGASDMFRFAYYAVDAATEESTDADGNTTAAVTEKTLAEAKATADKILAAYKSGIAPAAAAAAGTSTEAEALVAAAAETTAAEDSFNAAVASVVADASSTPQLVDGSSISTDYADWMMGNVKSGDATVVETATGATVVLFISRDDNHYKPVTVRHILISAEADENGKFSSEAIEAAYASAKALYDQWLAGDKTEESFAALAVENSADAGSSADGGLYENITKGTTVAEFNNFCFGNRKPGDTALVYGSNGAYAGFHIIYFVGTADELYSSNLAKTDLVNQFTNEWLSDAVSGLNSQQGYFVRLVA